MVVKKKFHFVMIKPTHYDDEGYLIQWILSTIPSNSLASVYGLAQDSEQRNVLGDDVSIEMHAIDESNTYVDVDKIVKMIKGDGGHGLIGFIGVQSNQYPRALDLAKRFRKHDIQVCIGGFHVSGVISMLRELTPELKEAQELGISLFAGEAEERRLDIVLQDAYNKQLRPLYNYLNSMPILEKEPVPFLKFKVVKKTFQGYSSFDLGRGCPFDCSYCTIINVQGKKSRYRTPDDVEKILRSNYKIGINKFFLTDDNFARNQNWEIILDRVIALRKEGIKIMLTIQVDTVCHKIPNFIEKCAQAGVNEVFIGLENINQDNLLAVKKKQNKVKDYKEFLLSWKRFPVVITAGYIIGLPHDTKQSVIQDVQTIKNELPIDIMCFFAFTPLPGSEDHQKMFLNGEWMDSDLNKYDLNHVVMKHPKMNDKEFKEAYAAAWDTYYTTDHLKTVLKRMVALGSNKKIATFTRFLMYKEYKRMYHLHPLEGGLIKIKHRKERRNIFPIESFFIFYPKYFFETTYFTFRMLFFYIKYKKIMQKIWKDPANKKYTDNAIVITKETGVFRTSSQN